MKTTKELEKIKRRKFKTKAREVIMERTKEENISTYKTFERKLKQILVHHAKSLTQAEQVELSIFLGVTGPRTNSQGIQN